MARGILPNERCMVGDIFSRIHIVHPLIQYDTFILYSLVADTLILLPTIRAIEPENLCRLPTSTSDCKTKRLLTKLDRMSSLFDLALYLDDKKVTDYSIAGAARRVNGWIYTRHLDLSIEFAASVIDAVCQDFVHKADNAESSLIVSMRDNKGLSSSCEERQKMVVLSSVALTEDTVDLPSPADLHPHRKTENEWVKAIYLFRHVKEMLSRENHQSDVAKLDTVLTCSNQIPTKSEKMLIIPEAYLDDKEKSKRACDENIELPESDQMSVNSAGSLMPLSDENESNETVVADEEMSMADQMRVDYVDLEIPAIQPMYFHKTECLFQPLMEICEISEIVTQIFLHRFEKKKIVTSRFPCKMDQNSVLKGYTRTITGQVCKEENSHNTVNLILKRTNTTGGLYRSFIKSLTSFYGHFSKLRSSKYLFLTTLLLMCGGASAGNVHMERSSPDSVLLHEILSLSRFIPLPMLEEHVDHINMIKSVNENMRSIISDWMLIEICELEIFIVGYPVMIENLTIGYNHLHGGLVLLEEKDEFPVMIENLTIGFNHLYGGLVLLEEKDEFPVLIENLTIGYNHLYGGLVLIEEISQMLFLICLFMAIGLLLFLNKSQNKSARKFNSFPNKKCTFLLVAATAIVIIVTVKINVGKYSAKQKSYEVSNSILFGIGVCPAICTVANCVISYWKNSYSNVATNLLNLQNAQLALTCQWKDKMELNVQIAIEQQCTEPAYQTFCEICALESNISDISVAHNKAKYRPPTFDLSENSEEENNWHRNKYIDESTSNAASARSFTYRSARCIVICLCVLLFFARLNHVHDSYTLMFRKILILCKLQVCIFPIQDYTKLDEEKADLKSDESTNGPIIVKEKEIQDSQELESAEIQLLKTEIKDAHVCADVRIPCDQSRKAFADTCQAQYDEVTDSLSLAGTQDVDKNIIGFMEEFRIKLLEYWSSRFRVFNTDVTSQEVDGFIVYEESAYDVVGVSLKNNLVIETHVNEETIIKSTGYFDKSYDSVIEDQNNHEMSRHVFPVMTSPRNEPEYDPYKPELQVIDHSGNNAEYLEPFEDKLGSVSNEKTVVDRKLNMSTDISTGVYDYFSNMPSGNATVADEVIVLLANTSVLDAEHVYEPLCKEGKTILPAKQKNYEPTIDDDDAVMANIRPMSILSELTDLPAHSHIDESYLRTLVYRIEEPLLAVIERLASDEPPTPHISMRYELLRFCTLRTYPRGDKPYLIRLAAAGFYYASDGDGVVCYCCGSRRYNWTGREDPMKVHQGIKPNCKFLKKNDEVNVPVEYIGALTKSLSALDAIPEPNRIQDEEENVNREYAPDRENDRNQETVHEQQTLGINNAEPKHSHYSIKSQRLKSFKEWPESSKLKPEELSNAGFFYAGFGDCVRCFFCGVGLRHWSDDDDPWVEHARWARTCVFVRQKKGEEFVNLVQLAVQFTQDNGTTESGAGNKLPVSTIEKLLLSKAALNAAEMGFHSDLIKRAVEETINNGVTENISPDDLLNTLLAIRGNEERATASENGGAKTNGSKDKTAEDPKGELVKDDEHKTDSMKKTSEYNENKKKSDIDSELSQDPVAIKHENEVLKEQTLCKVCLDNTVCIVFLPCGHLVTCADCAPAMRKCPICRALVRGTVRTYMS